jgi:hypothetical protein
MVFGWWWHGGIAELGIMRVGNPDISLGMKNEISLRNFSARFFNL